MWRIDAVPPDRRVESEVWPRRRGQFYAFPLGSLPTGNYHMGTTEVCLFLGTWVRASVVQVRERVIRTASSVYGFLIYGQLPGRRNSFNPCWPTSLIQANEANPPKGTFP